MPVRLPVLLAAVALAGVVTHDGADPPGRVTIRVVEEPSDEAVPSGTGARICPASCADVPHLMASSQRAGVSPPAFCCPRLQWVHQVGTSPNHGDV